MDKKWDAIWINGTLATCEQGYGLLHNAAIAVSDEKIAWVGGVADLPASAYTLANNVYDVTGQCITPGFIDCHTHLVYAGNRAHEFELRLQGVTYEQIARDGGGIQSTVKATRAASEQDLLEQSLKRAWSLMRSGVTTLEIKSGYGLDLETEIKILRVAKQLQGRLPITVSSTFLGAHTVPLEYKGRADAYIDLVCNEMIPVVANEQLAEAVDVFCESIAFNLMQTQRVFEAAKHHGLAIKCHAEQLSDSGSAALAAKYHAWSVDHLEHLSHDGVTALAESGTVAVLLPGAFYFLREKQLPPIELMQQHHIPIAIASDCNPGTSPITSLRSVLNMACTLFRLTPEQALLGVTKQAARALGKEKTHGTLTVGKAADFAVWDAKEIAELVYYMGNDPLLQLIKNGKIIKTTYAETHHLCQSRDV